jgi:predicted DNA-binding transcriptional regulator YafY
VVERVRSSVGQWATERVDTGRCRLRMTVESLDWPVSVLGMVGADFEVIAPPGLAERIREWGERLARAADPASGAP